MGRRVRSTSSTSWSGTGALLAYVESAPPYRTRGQFGDVHGIYLRLRWPLTEQRLQLGDRFVAAFGNDLDSSIGKVLSPAAEAEPGRVTVHEPAKTDALYQAAHQISPRGHWATFRWPRRQSM